MTRRSRTVLVSLALTLAGLAALPGPAPAENYAILFSGGGGLDDNNSTFYDTTIRMYHNLVGNLHFNPYNIYILAADGLDPAIDQHHVWPIPDRNSDWTSVEDYTHHVFSGTHANLQNLLGNLALGRQDLFILWTNDHGAETGEHNSANLSEGLIAWSGFDIMDTDLAAWTAPLAAHRQAYIFTQCYSDGMIDEMRITPGQGRSAMAAAQHWETSRYDYVNTSFGDAVSNAIEHSEVTTRGIFDYAYDDDWFRWAGYELPQFHGDNIDLTVAEDGGAYPFDTWDHIAWISAAPNMGRTVRINYPVRIPAGVDAAAGYLTLDGGTVTSHVTLQGGGTLHSVCQVIGNTVGGRFTQTGGTNTVDEDLVIGAKAGYQTFTEGALLPVTVTPGELSSYEMYGGSLHASCIIVGDGGRGYMIHTDGGVTVSARMFLGGQAGGEGTYELDGDAAVLTTNATFVGESGTGLFIHRRGTHHVNTSLDVGHLVGSSGTYCQSGGFLQAADEFVGVMGRGEYQHNGGRNTISGTLTVGRNDMADGTYRLLGPTAELSADSEIIGDWGVGRVAHNAGTNTVTHDIVMGGHLSGDGTYIISGSTARLSAHALSVGSVGSGLFDQSGVTDVRLSGTLMVGDAGLGTYNLGGTATLSALAECFGNTCNGDMVQTGGTNTVANAVVIASQTGATGSYTISVGRLSATDFVVADAGGGWVNHTGGTVALTGALVLGNAWGSSGAYTLDHDADLSAADVRIGLGGEGVLTHAGGTLHATHAIAIGWQAGARGTYNLDGGSATCDGWVSVGYGDTGHFRQRGGRLSVATLYVGDQPGVSGDYALQGGEVSVLTDAYIGCGGQGAVTQSAPSTCRVGRNLYIGFAAGAKGMYTISGGTLDVRDGQLAVGVFGRGTLAVNGGTVIADSLYRGDDGHLGYGGSSGVLRVNSLSGFGTTPWFGCSLQLGHSGGAGTASYAVSAMLGSLTVGGDLGVGYDAPAQFDQTNPMAAVHVGGTLYVGQVAGGDGAYSLDGLGSVLNAAAERIGEGGRGTFNHNGGTNTVAGSVVVGASGTGVYHFNGGRLEAHAVTVGGAGSGTFDWHGGTFVADEVEAAPGGRFNATDADWTFAGALRVSGGTVELASRSFTLDGPAATADITSGMFGAGGTCVGYVSRGSVNQQGGIVAAGSTLVIGSEVGSHGSYALGGLSVLMAGAATIGGRGDGQFTQKDGQALFGGTVTIGAQPGSHGSCTLAGGEFRTPTLAVGDGDVGVLEIGAAALVSVTSEFHLGPHATFHAAPGATVHLPGSAFTNTSTSPADVADLGNLTLVFEGGPSVLDAFEVAGRDLGPVWAGFASNFALGTLELGGAQTGSVRLVDAFDNQPGWDGREALYVDDLILASGSMLDLGGLNLYYRDLAGDLGAVKLSGGSITQVPEPATLALMAVSLATMARQRRR